ncbi:competence protein CoiA family protein [Planctobacterium marinum]|uniref:hypothetical protein n=1 Tax=Planctobacterium marinum TaxID=1631968 RepID=UPI001E3A3F82|nr:hypothetical protein [Planctobacterium marinum]MCC2606589.1 hypothetical protein [Planctobacterium marinum]
MTKLKIPYGLDNDSGSVRWITEFNRNSNGLKCNCVCPSCNTDLVANIGTKKRWYFSYKHSTERRCNETALHKIGKLILSQLVTFSSTLTLPIKKQSFEDMLANPCHPVDTITPFKHLSFINAKLESRMMGDNTVQPDILVDASINGSVHQIAFEIKVHNAVDKDKHLKLANIDLTTLELDLSHLLKEESYTESAVTQALLDPKNHQCVHISREWKRELINQNNINTSLNLNEINSKILRSLEKINANYKNKLLQLPPVKYEKPDCHWVHRRIAMTIPNDVIKTSIDELPTPKNDHNVVIKSLRWKRNGRFELSFTHKSQLKTIPLLVYQVAPPKKQRTFSYLVAAPHYFNDEMSFFEKLKWGHNVRTTKYRAQCIQSLKKTFYRHTQDAKKCLNQLIYSRQNIGDNIRKSLPGDSIDCFEKSIAWASRILRSRKYDWDFFVPQIDPLYAFSVSPRAWQYVLLREIASHGIRLVYIENLDRTLTNLGLEIAPEIKMHSDSLILLGQSYLLNVRYYIEHYIQALVENNFLYKQGAGYWAAPLKELNQF